MYHRKEENCFFFHGNAIDSVKKPCMTDFINNGCRKVFGEPFERSESSMGGEVESTGT